MKDFSWGILIGAMATLALCILSWDMNSNIEKKRQFNQNPDAYCQLLPLNSPVPYGCIKYLNK